ncbi:DUF3027 domain-containing protein [Bifidobacterium olomucense]|uniref:DUF3027 domain-containing protein n=1 Tax=Bifidobacterium olomucense TaxID=2675324 RepID=A0A7Y0HUS3_9BIFI|nr:DUF3027 domain-containing protein [Bifidobacterium sp. DSM 109959]NMM97470.1 hypothetical protein [Bifidobacterium sp. DSM 109959]
MTDTTETVASPDPRAIARAVLLEVADEPEQVGDFVVAQTLEDHVTDFRFAAHVRGYEGWQWSVTLYHDEELDSWTVNESSLIPTEDALMPPKWIPWKDRLEPTDLAPTDSIGTDPDDERMEPGEVAESSLEDVNDAVQTFRLTRRHVLSSLGRAQAAQRWYEGPRGPKALSTKTADGNLCSTCGFFVPLAGELDRMFGVCANKWSPDDGRVVSLDHGCGEHSEIEPPEPSHIWVQSKPAFDDFHIDVVASPSRKRAEAADEVTDMDAEDVLKLARAHETGDGDDEGETADRVADASDGAEGNADAGSVVAADAATATTAETTVDDGREVAQGSAVDDGAAVAVSVANDDSMDEAVAGASDAEAVEGPETAGEAEDVASGNADDDAEHADGNSVTDAGDFSDAGDIDDADDDEATEEDILNNTVADDDDMDDEEDEDDDEPSDDVAPGLETVIDLIEQLRQSRADSIDNDDIDYDGTDAGSTSENFSDEK